MSHRNSMINEEYDLPDCCTLPIKLLHQIGASARSLPTMGVIHLSFRLMEKIFCKTCNEDFPLNITISLITLPLFHKTFLIDFPMHMFIIQLGIKQIICFIKVVIMLLQPTSYIFFCFYKNLQKRKVYFLKGFNCLCFAHFFE